MRAALRQGIAAALIASFLWTQSVATFGQADATVQEQIVKAAVEKIGVGKQAGVRLATGEVVRGRITGISQDSFSLQPIHTKTRREIAYSQVLRLKKNSNTLLWAVMGVSVVAIVTIVIALARTPTVHPYTPPAP